MLILTLYSAECGVSEFSAIAGDASSHNAATDSQNCARFNVARDDRIFATGSVLSRFAKRARILSLET